MRFLLLTILILFCGNLLSQDNLCTMSDDRTPTQIEIDEALYRKNLQTARSSRAYNDEKIIPVVVNVLHSGNYSYPGFGDWVSESAVNSHISELNDYFSSGWNTGTQSSTGFTFVLADKDIDGNPGFEGYRVFNLQDYPSFLLYSGASSSYLQSVDHLIRNQFGYEWDHYLNIFYISMSGSVGGWAAVPPGNLGIFINSNTGGISRILTHEGGHFLGLWHTFAATVSNDEYTSCLFAQSESNCETQGDGVCDTGPTVLSFSCISPCGTENEDPRNWLSYSFNSCNSGKFSDGQIERMHVMMETYRSDMIDHGQFLYGTTSGCTDPTKCNYDPNAITDDGGCLENDALGICGGTCPADVDNDDICDNVDTCLTGADIDNDGICDSIDPCIGIPDLDNDGVCDDVDPCVGTLDVCNVCNGPGAIYECGCADIPEGDCDCNGNQLDALGVCGGPCLADLDGDGICDSEQVGVCGGISSVSYHGFDYDLISIGNQCWFNSNLQTDRYNDNSLITKANTTEAWVTQSGARLPILGYVDYDNVANTAAYGLLYNWYAVETGKLCPSGYHVPTDEEWMQLERHLGLEEHNVIREDYRISANNVGAKLRDGGNSGFDSKYAGLLVEADGTQRDLTKAAYFWSSTEYKNVFESERNNAWFRVVYGNLSGVGRYNEAWQTANNKGNGMSVRCLKD